MKKAVSVGLLLMMVLAITLTPSPVQSTPDPIWVKMLGRIDSYGEDVASGLLVAHAKVEEWARVRGFYVPGLNFSKLKPPQPIPSNFTVSFHAVKLVNATEVKLNYGDNDFYISGFWNVCNVTFIHYGWHNFTLIVEPVVIYGAGELNVTGTWTDFTLDITGNELVRGKVFFFAVVGGFRPIPMGDCSGPTAGTPDRRINIWDLVRVAKAYGSTPGNPWIPNYDVSMDFDFDYRIGLAELTTIAANLGIEY